MGRMSKSSSFIVFYLFYWHVFGLSNTITVTVTAEMEPISTCFKLLLSLFISQNSSYCIVQCISLPTLTRLSYFALKQQMHDELQSDWIFLRRSGLNINISSKICRWMPSKNSSGYNDIRWHAFSYSRAFKVKFLFWNGTWSSEASKAGT